MSSDLRSLLGVGGLIVLASVVGAALFLFTGFEQGIWFTVAGIPTVVVAGVAVYVRGVVSRGGTSERQYVRNRGREVAETFQSVLRERNDLTQAYPRWAPNVEAQESAIVESFHQQGVTVDRETGSFELTDGADSAEVEEFEHLETQIATYENEFEESFREFVEAEFERMETVHEHLAEAELVDIEAQLSTPTGGSIAEYRDSLDRERDEIKTALYDAVKQVREMSRGDTRPDDVDRIDATLEEATDDIDRLEYRQASDAILEARDQLRDQLSGSFDTERKELTALVDTVLESDVDKHVDAEYVQDVEAASREIEALDSSLDLAELTRHRSTLRRTAIDMIAEMEQDLEDAVETLDAADLPPGYYQEPDIVGISYIDKLSDLDDFAALTDRWSEIANRLTEALETAETKAAVVEAYDDVAETIDAELQQNGQISEDRLPVKHGGQFLGLYYRRNDNVEFDPETATLYRGSVASHDVTVTVTYEEGGQERTATVELDGGGYSETSVVETHVAASVGFENVPEGSYTLSARPGTDTFSSVTREVSVTSDSEFSLTFERRSLREQVCAKTDIDMETHLAEVGSNLESRFDESGYLSTEMELPVKSTHAPCLVATWAEKHGYHAAETDDGIIVFDREKLIREVENVVRYNLDEGDALSFSETRERFLSVPVPDSVLRSVVADLETERTARTTDSTISVE